jgi:acetolactate synthase-1/2/3 large subunit
MATVLGIRAIDTRHEQAAALAAHGWGRVMRRPGVAMGVFGPGATCSPASRTRSPTLYLGGRTARTPADAGGERRVPTMAVTAPSTSISENARVFSRVHCGRWNETVVDPCPAGR